jgi:hypothetical protein
VIVPVKPLDLGNTFKSLRALLARYQPPLAAKIDDARRYELWSRKDVVIDGRKRSEVFFASAVIQKGYVGFYYMPVYTSPGMKKLFAPELLSLLKGKSCFHIKTLDARLLTLIKRALDEGLKLYKKNGWV